MTGPPLEVLLSPDKFKGSLTAVEAAEALEAGFSDVRSGARIERFAVSDGGDGLIDAVLPHGFIDHAVTVDGPTGVPHRARIATREHTAVVELAEVVGTRRLPAGRPAPLTASTHGLGQAMLAALDLGVDEIVVGLGGSASTDGGAGMLQALGADLRNADGGPVGRGGAALAELASIDLSGLDARLHQTPITVASDVDSPLLGEHGAARTFAAQKGATPREVEELEAAMAAWAAVVSVTAGARRLPESAPGAGAAGGTGYAALALLGATMRSGIDLLLGLGDFDSRLRSADLVVVGEGCLDPQSLHGKAPVGIAQAASRAGVEVVAACGVNRLAEVQWRSTGLSAVYSLAELEPDLDRSMRTARSLLRRLGSTIAEVHPHRRSNLDPTERLQR